MGTVGTFDTFTTARLGIYAAQKGLSVTGNNIANINTVGYTRQVLDQVSLKTGAHDMYRSQYDNHVGNGTLVTGISQIRDPYLDIRFRNTNADVGYYDESLNGMQQIAKILDEVGKGENKGDGMLYAQLQDLAESLRAISADPNDDNDTLARTSADALVTLFNTYANKLENLRLNYVDSLKQDVKMVNDILTNIRNLNESIRESDVHGDPALEMRDERNRQIDELSKYMHIKVTYSMEKIGGGIEIEKLTIALANDNPDTDVKTDSSVLIDGIYGSQISMPETLPAVNEQYDPKYAAANKNLIDAQNLDLDNPDDVAKLDPRGFLYVKPGQKPAYDGTGADPYDGSDTADMFTDDPAEAGQVKNDNYIITISKLYNAGGEEWTNPTTKWEAVGGSVGQKAKFAFKLDSKDWAAGDTFTVGDQIFTVRGTKKETDGDGNETTTPVPGQISVSDANDPEKMAAFIAGKISNDDYNVKAVGGTIIYTAKKIGEVTDANAPEPDFAKAGGTGTLTSTRETRNQGSDSVPPQGATNSHTWNENGSETSVVYVEGETSWLRCTMTTEHTYDVTLDDNDLHGSLQAARELLTEAGEFATNDTIAKVDESAATKRGIPYYQRSLDLLARQFAEQYNKLNQGFMVNEEGNYITGDGTELTLAGDPISKTKGLTAAQKQALIDDGCVVKDEVDADGNPVPDLNRWLGAKDAKVPEGVGVLFSNRGDNNDPSGITAANISVSAGWSGGDVKIVPTFVELFGKDPGPMVDANGNPVLDKDGNPLPNTTQNENVNHMLTMIDKSLVYDPKDLVGDANGTKLFMGSFNDMFSNMNIVLGNDQRTTNIKLNSQYTSLVEIDTSRDGVSGVDLNDEAMNMMQYQKAYSAACRLMTAIDEALERLINNTGIAGR